MLGVYSGFVDSSVGRIFGAVMKVTLKKPVSDKGYCWESELFSRKFNDLPEDQQYGEIVEDGMYPYKVRWPAINYTTCSLVFGDEVNIEP